MAAALSMPLGNFHVASFPTGEDAAVERQLFAPGGQGESALASRVPPSAATMPAGTVASAARRPIEGSTRREHVARSGSAAAIVLLVSVGRSASLNLPRKKSFADFFEFC